MRHFFKLAMVVGLGALAGCGPTYNEALQTQENELKMMDRLANDNELLHQEFLDKCDAASYLAKEKSQDPDERYKLSKAAIENVKNEYKAKFDASDAAMKEQQARVDAARKSVDELNRSK